MTVNIKYMTWLQLFGNITYTYASISNINIDHSEATKQGQF